MSVTGNSLPLNRQYETPFIKWRNRADGPEKLDLPGLDNPNDIQLAIAKVAQALVDGKLEPKAASTLSYVLQLALSNVNRLDYENIEEDPKGK